MKRRRLPEFESQRELVRFLDNPELDLSRYDLTTIGEPGDLEIDEERLRLQEETEYRRGERLRPVTMRLDASLVRALKRIAAGRGLSYQTLARIWLRERAIEELRGEGRHPSLPRQAAWPARVGEQTRLERLLAEVHARLGDVLRQRRREGTARTSGARAKPGA